MPIYSTVPGYSDIHWVNSEINSSISPNETITSPAYSITYDVGTNDTTVGYKLSASGEITMLDSSVASILYNHGIYDTSVTSTGLTGSNRAIFNQNGDQYYLYYQTVSEESHKEQIKRQIRQNILIKSGFRSDVNQFKNISPAERRAMKTLHEMISEKEWRRYLGYGFVVADGESQKQYQIFREKHKRIKVYDRGDWIKNLCIHSENVCPPTDHVISMKTLAEIDEPTLWDLSNKHEVMPRVKLHIDAEKAEPLPTMWERLKKTSGGLYVLNQ